MTSIKRRRRITTTIRALLLTLLAVIADSRNMLTRVEHILYDTRAAYCQRYTPKPTDRLIHLDIDDIAINQIGRWPWDREMLAQIMDEVRIAGPKVLVLDLVFPERDRPTYDAAHQLVDQDAILADSMRKLGRVLVPSSISFEEPDSQGPLQQKLVALLSDDPELTADECAQRLGTQGMKSPTLQADVGREFLAARPRAILDRIERELNSGLSNPALLRQKLLPHADPLLTGTVLGRLFDEEYARALRENELVRFTLPQPPALDDVLKMDEDKPPMTPILPLSQAARYGAFVDYLRDKGDGTVRYVPLVASYKGRLMPCMSIAAACALLDVDVRQLQLTPHSVTIPRPNGKDIVIPVSTRDATEFGDASMLMEVPLFGKTDSGWLTMYDYPKYQKPSQHASVYEVWRVCLTQRRLANNEAAADLILPQALGLTDPQAAADYRAAPLKGVARRKLIDTTLENMGEVSKGLSSVPELGPDEKALLQNFKTYDAQLRQILKQNDAMEAQIETFRAELREKLGGRAVFVGGAGTGLVDVVSTTLHTHCPGVVVHGALFNGILTGRMWRMAPKYVTTLVIIVMGLLAGVLVSKLSPLKASVAAAALAAGYLLLNGYVLFDYGQIIVGAAGPVLAVGLVWSGVTLTDFVSEIAERNRITRRFRNYVDPSLVNYVIEHPEQARFDGEAREMTMGFTDLAGFTNFTESLGPRTVPLLSEYMNRMIPTIRANNGFVSRLMGDGIFFFFNAPGPDPAHAAHAVSTVLAMHKALDEMNLTLPQRGFPTLHMRAGICTGTVIVGDAGSGEFSDYTAIGNSVNTAARFESANKFFGTKTLISDRTVELLKSQFLVRPIAKVRVVGRSQGLLVYEPLSRVEHATTTQKQLAESTTKMVDAFLAGNFAICMEVASAMDLQFGVSKLTELYRELCNRHLAMPPVGFDGEVVLTEK